MCYRAFRWGVRSVERHLSHLHLLLAHTQYHWWPSLVRSVHSQGEISRPQGASVFFLFGMNGLVISVQAQPFLYWLAAPVLLPGGWLKQLSFGFMCCRATGVMEFVVTMHVVCSTTSHVVVSTLPVPEIHCGLLFVFSISHFSEQSKNIPIVPLTARMAQTVGLFGL